MVIGVVAAAIASLCYVDNFTSGAHSYKWFGTIDLRCSAAIFIEFSFVFDCSPRAHCVVLQLAACVTPQKI